MSDFEKGLAVISDLTFGDEVELHQGTTSCHWCKKTYNGSPKHLGYDKCNTLKKISVVTRIRDEKRSGYTDEWDFEESHVEGERKFKSAWGGGDVYEILEIKWIACGKNLSWNNQYAWDRQQNRSASMCSALMGNFEGAGYLLDYWDQIPEEIKKCLFKASVKSLLNVEASISVLQGAIQNLDQRMNNAAQNMYRG